MKLNTVGSQVLNQLAAVVRQLTTEDFSKPASVLNQATLGQHVRHTLEFFQCLESGLPARWVNYDDREHNEFVQADPELALGVIDRLTRFVEQQEGNVAVKLQVSYDRSGESAQVVDSNYLRELIYTIEHAVHHMALIKIGLKEVAPYVRVPEDFGIAVSTLRHQQALLSDR